jgi:D-alanyl-D-alanine carboxypeptidase
MPHRYCKHAGRNRTGRGSRVPTLVALLAALLLSVSPVETWAAEPYSKYLEAAYQADGPGATAIVVRDGEVVYRDARGMAHLELGVPLSPDHVFRLGSITKQFTAAAIMLLAEQGKLSTDDEITKFLPEHPIHGHEITVEHLLTHTSGIFSYTSIPGYMLGSEIRADLSTEELIEVFSDLEMDFKPGEDWSYSNSGYVLLGAIIERVSGKPYPEFAQEHLFGPLEMHNSHYGGPQLISGRVQGYAGTAGNYVNAPFISMTQPHAAGSLLSNVDDLARWNAALHGGELLSSESVDRMTGKHTETGSGGAYYGYGLGVSTFLDEPIVLHGGGIHGFATFSLWLPETKVFVAVLSNSAQNPVRPGYVAYALAAEAIGRPFPSRSVITLQPGTLSDYVGLYRGDDDRSYRMTTEEAHLFFQGPDGPRREALPYAPDSFFFESSHAHLSFHRDAEGPVTSLRIHRPVLGETVATERTSESADDRETAVVSPELYDLWSGTYEIGPGFEMDVRREGDELVCQATGQPSFQLHPESAYRYFVKEFPAEIEFVPGDDGHAKALVLYQGGQETRAERMD